jgi:hypothetical protein
MSRRKVMVIEDQALYNRIMSESGYKPRPRIVRMASEIGRRIRNVRAAVKGLEPEGQN